MSNLAKQIELPLPLMPSIVPESKRLDFLPEFDLVRYEMQFYHLADTYLEDYTGGYWQFAKVQSTIESEEPDAPLMILDQTAPVCISNPNNYSGPFVTSTLTASVALMLMFLSRISFQSQNPIHADAYHILREWAFDSENSHIDQHVVAAITD